MATKPFDPADVKKFVPVSQKVISMARVLGWDIRWKGVQHDAVELRSPEGDRTINIPTGSVNANRAKSWARAIFRYTDDVHLARLVNGELNLVGEDETVQSIVGTFGTEIITMLKEKAETAPVRDRAFEVVNPVAPQKDSPMSVKADIPAADPKMLSGRGKRLVSVEPYMVKDKNHATDLQGRPIMHPSQYVTVRTYDDGSVTYGCTWPECGYEGKSQSSVLIHRHKHTGVTKVPHKKNRQPEPESRPMVASVEERNGHAVIEPRPTVEDLGIEKVIDLMREAIRTEYHRKMGAMELQNVLLTQERDALLAERNSLRENLSTLKALLKDL